MARPGSAGVGGDDRLIVSSGVVTLMSDSQEGALRSELWRGWRNFLVAEERSLPLCFCCQPQRAKSAADAPDSADLTALRG